MRRLALVAAGLLVPTLALAEPPAPAPRVERDVVEVAPPKGALVTGVAIENRYGDVRVEGHDGQQVSIVAVKQAPDEDGLERLKVTLVPDPGGAVSVSAALRAGAEERPMAAGSVRIDLVVRVPRNARVMAQVWKGSLDVSGLDNGAELVNEQGDIQVKQVSGTVSAESALGSQRFAEVFGRVMSRAVEGDLSLDLVRGDGIDATVYKGRIDGRRIKVKNVTVRVMHGDLRLAIEPLAGGHYILAANHGDVALEVSGKVPVAVHSHGGGSLSLPARLRHRTTSGDDTRGVLGSGRSTASVELSSRLGSITLAEF